MKITSRSIKKISRSVSLFYFVLLSHLIYAQSSSAKIDSLNRIAGDHLSSRPQKAVQFAMEAIKLNGRSLYSKGRYSSYLNLGISYSNLGQYDSAILYLRKAERYFLGEFEEALIKYYIGVNYCNMRGYTMAKDFFQESRDLFQSSENYAQTADPLRALGFIAVQQEDYESALIYLFRATELKSQYGLASNAELELIALAFKKMGSLDKAIQYEKMALSENQIYSLPREELIEGFLRLASLFSARSDLDSAIWSYKEGLRLSDSRFEIASGECLLGLAEILDKQGRSSAGIDEIRNTLQRVNEIETEIKLQLELRLAEMYFSIGRADSASYFGKLALNSARASSLNEQTAEALALLIRISKREGSVDSTLVFYEQQARLLKELYDSAVTHRELEWSRQVMLLDMVSDQAIASQQMEIFTLKRERLVLALLLFLGVGVILLVLALYWYRGQLVRGIKEKNGIKKSMQKAQEDLYKQTLHMMHMNNCLEEVEQQVKHLMAANPNQKLSNILKSIRMNKSMERDWENFNSYFGNVNTGFYEKLSDYSEKLSNHDRRVCALIKLNLTNREIATILNIEVKSVSMIKYRIKKKLVLEDEVELSQFITQL